MGIEACGARRKNARSERWCRGAKVGGTAASVVVSGEVYEPLRNSRKQCAQWPREFRSETAELTAESR